MINWTTTLTSIKGHPLFDDAFPVMEMPEAQVGVAAVQAGVIGLEIDEERIQNLWLAEGRWF